MPRATGRRLLLLGAQLAGVALGLLVLSLPGCAAPARPSQPAATGRPGPLPHRAPPAAAHDLIGETPNSVVAALGPPRLRRIDGPAEVWLYGGGGCRLDLVFYRDRATLRVAMATAHTPPRTTEAACLKHLAAAP